MQADGAAGWWLAGAGFALTLLLIGRQRVPAAVVLVALGVAYAWTFKMSPAELIGGVGLHLPQWRIPATEDVWLRFWLLALPQIPLSITNSVLATRQLAEDLFPEKGITAGKIGWSYSAMNLINPFLGGAPTCHGSGGMAGHYAFGGRTGGSVIIYGVMYLALGLLFGPGFEMVVGVFPLPILGVLLLFEAITLIALVRDVAGDKTHFMIAALVGLIAGSVPYGYLVGLLVGMAAIHLSRRGLTRFGAA